MQHDNTSNFNNNWFSILAELLSAIMEMIFAISVGVGERSLQNVSSSDLQASLLISWVWGGGLMLNCLAFYSWVKEKLYLFS